MNLFVVKNINKYRVIKLNKKGNFELKLMH